jgi:uncharacterized protein (DUF1810 family)
MSKHNEALERFIEAQRETYDQALKEIKAGHKVTHWMWWIFPQYKGLGYSNIAQFYAIQSQAEARAYIHHPILGKRLKECLQELLRLETSDAVAVFGGIDALKLKSCLTLFFFSGGKTLCGKVLDKFYGGELDSQTKMRLLVDGR